ncbi:MAG: hypothetical protein AAFY73_07650 [Pseudomonadota bacterium]
MIRLLKLAMGRLGVLAKPPNNKTTRAFARYAWSTGEVKAGGLLVCDGFKSFHEPGLVSNTYMSDQSGLIEYKLNAAGYRGELPDPDAEIRVCLIGESVAFGEGVDYADALQSRLKTLLAQATGLPADKVNIVNLAIGGASSDFCTRSLARQFNNVQPHLILYVVPAPDRLEFNEEEDNVNYAFSNFDLERLEEAPISAQGFCDLYNPLWGCVNWAKNLLFFQQFCHMRGVEHLAISPGPDWVVTQRPAVQNFLSQIDRERYLELSVKSYRPDVAADTRHIGPETHRLLAIACIDRLAQTLGSQPDFPWQSKLVAFANARRNSDPDWKAIRQHWFVR